jgi:pimeloyl-ACP methyl ester carboxylesterase
MAEIVNINGSDIRFEIHGEGIPIVYTPGGFYPLEKGGLIAERLKALGYKVLLWDRPSTGGSELLFEGSSLLRIWADKLRELLHYLSGTGRGGVDQWNGRGSRVHGRDGGTLRLAGPIPAGPAEETAAHLHGSPGLRLDNESLGPFPDGGWTCLSSWLES